MRVHHQLSTLCDECGWRHVREVTGDSFEGWRAKQTYCPKTLNEYLGALTGFMKWLRKTGRFEGDPLRAVEKIDESSYERRQRRAITPQQVTKLLEVSGRRAVVYLVAAYTGLRRKELGLLEWRDVKADGDNPAIHMRAHH